jgi:hypothetical protein
VQDYTEFAQSELNKLIPIQEKFKEKYKIDSYEKWFYESEFSLLRLYNSDEDEIFFRYIPIGTYSKNSETWMWAWFNESSEEPNKDESLKIKQFGIENNYPKLFNGSFPSDEFDGWEFLSISLFLLDGIGVYKVTSDHLEKYLLLTAVYENHHSSEIQRMKQSKVNCRTHGFGRAAFVCQHLSLQTKKGFEEAFETHPKMNLEEGDDFQAWCSECEQIRLSTNGWKEESENFAKIKLVCEYCYFELKEFNQ